MHQFHQELFLSVSSLAFRIKCCVSIAAASRILSASITASLMSLASSPTNRSMSARASVSRLRSITGTILFVKIQLVCRLVKHLFEFAVIPNHTSFQPNVCRERIHALLQILRRHTPPHLQPPRCNFWLRNKRAILSSVLNVLDSLIKSSTFTGEPFLSASASVPSWIGFSMALLSAEAMDVLQCHSIFPASAEWLAQNQPHHWRSGYIINKPFAHQTHA